MNDMSAYYQIDNFQPPRVANVHWDFGSLMSVKSLVHSPLQTVFQKYVRLADAVRIMRK